MKHRMASVFAFALLLTVLTPISTTMAQVPGTDVLYTTDADFDQGTLAGVNHDAPYNDQLQLDSPTEPFPFINVAASGRGTVVRANTATGQVVGEYRTAPDGRGLDPSRTTVDLFGNVWTANRGEVEEIDGVPHGSAVKIGLIVGGTRVNGDGTPNPEGEYLAPPFGYNTCVDRNRDGLIRTSRGLLDILDWPDGGDGLGGPDGLVENAVDECILIYQRLPNAEQARHVSVDADNNVWVGGFPFAGRMFYKLAGNDGAVLDSFDARDFGCGGYGGLIDGNGILWSIGWGTGDGALLRYDPVTRTGSCVDISGGYGLGIDTNGYVWGSIWENGIAKVSPDGVLHEGFPKSTYLASSTSAAAAGSMATDAQLALPAMTMEIQADSADGTPTFWAAPSDDWVGAMSPWTPGATISLTIEDGSGVIYSDSQTADGAGNFNFDLWGVFDVHHGHVVTVSDGTTTKTHTVAYLFVDGVDVTADTVVGRASTGTDVDVWVHGDGGLTVTADSAGIWTADFSGVTDLTYLSDGGAGLFDDDGDATGVWWTPPRFQVSPDGDWIQSSGKWLPGATISLTIEDGSGVIYSDSQTADTDGRFNFNLWDVFDLHRGHVATVTDGTTTKTHTVMNLFVDGVDVTADTVFGRADAGTDVDVWVHGDGGLSVTADGSGNWVADFSGMTDLTYVSDGGSQQYDVDGDSTGDWWAGARFQANPDLNWVQSTSEWVPGATIALTIEDGSGVVYTNSQTVDSTGRFNFDLWGEFDLERGHDVTVSDGVTTKTHTVLDLHADTVDVLADGVTGRADPGTDVIVWIHGEGFGMTATADGSGHWTADFSGAADLTYLTEGGAEQSDQDGDSTAVEWFSPRFQVHPDDDTVGNWTGWTPGSTITLTIDDGSGIVLSDSTTVDTWGDFWLDLRGAFDIERGHTVTVSDGISTKTHTVLSLFITDVDATADTVSGTAEPGSEVEVQIHGGDETRRLVTSDAFGDWSADFSGVVDLMPNSEVSAYQIDGEGDVTWVSRRVPMFRVAPDTDQVDGAGWPDNAVLDVSIDYGGVDPYTTSVTTNQWGDFSLGLGGFDIQTGHVISITNETWLKAHTVTAVTVPDGGIDHDADTVDGVADPFAGVQVIAYLFGDWSSRWVQADASGNWTADFSTPSDGRPPFDITQQTFIEVEEFDPDGDSTVRRFGPPIQANRGVAVTPIDNHVWVANSGVGTVTRLDNGGNILEVIDVGNEPTGVAVDAAGKVWVTNLGSDNIVRIDPTAGAAGLGAVDLTVDLGPGAGPYNYSDMTGAVVVGSTSPQGFWTVVQDSGESGFEWGRITWNTEPEASEPEGTEIIVEARTADTEAGLGGAAFVSVLNGELFSSFGRYIEVRVTLKASPEGLSPVLSDIRVQPAIIEVDIDIKPGSYPNSINVKRAIGVVPVAVFGSSDFDVTTIDVTTLGFGPGGAIPAHDLTDPSTYQDHLQDVNADGFMDLVGHYPVAQIGLMKGDTEACIGGETVDGIPIAGCDSVRVIGGG